MREVSLVAGSRHVRMDEELTGGQDIVDAGSCVGVIDMWGMTAPGVAAAAEMSSSWTPHHQVYRCDLGGSKRCVMPRLLDMRVTLGVRLCQLQHTSYSRTEHTCCASTKLLIASLFHAFHRPCQHCCC